MRNNTIMEAANLLIIVSVAVGPGAFAQDGLAEWDSRVRDLSSERLDARSGAREAIRRELERLETAGDRKSLSAAVELLVGKRKEAEDLEAAEALNSLIAPYRAGGFLWCRTGEDVPGVVCSLEEVGDREVKFVVRGGTPLAARTWELGFDRRTGEVLKQREFAGYPEGRGQVFRQEGKTLFAGGFEGGFFKGREQPIGGWMEARDAESGETVWSRESRTLPGAVSALMVHGEDVFAGGVHGDGGTGSKSWLGAYDRQTGKTLWERGPGTLPVEGSCSMVFSIQVFPEGVLASGRGGRHESWVGLYEIQTGKTVWEKSVNDLPGWVDCHDATAEDLVLRGVTREGKSWLAAYRMRDGGKLWEKAAEAFPGKALLVHRTTEGILVGGDTREGKGWLATYRMRDGGTLWEKAAGSLPGGALLAHRMTDGIFVGGADGWMGLYDSAAGKTVWETEPGRLPGTVSSVIASGKRIVAVGRTAKLQGWLGVYELESGKALSEHVIGLPRIALSLHIRGGRIYAVGGWDIKASGWIGCYRLFGVEESE